MTAPPAIRRNRVVPGDDYVLRSEELEHRHTYRVWRKAGRWGSHSAPWWQHVGVCKAHDPWEAIDELRLGRGTFLCIHADRERIAAIAEGANFDIEDVQIVKRGWRR